METKTQWTSTVYHTDESPKANHSFHNSQPTGSPLHPLAPSSIHLSPSPSPYFNSIPPSTTPAHPPINASPPLSAAHTPKALSLSLSAPAPNLQVSPSSIAQSFPLDQYPLQYDLLYQKYNYQIKQDELKISNLLK